MSAPSSSTQPDEERVESIPDDIQPRHPLQHRWSFFYNPPTKPTAGGEWVSNVKKVSTFDSVEDFWRLFNTLKAPSQLTIGSNYHMFKDGIQPEWEDDSNKLGGKWTINLNRRGENAQKQTDEAWMYILLALIGEQFQDSDEICGVVIAPRTKETRLALWTRHGDDAYEAVVKRIGVNFKSVVEYPQPIVYQMHDDSIQNQSSYRTQHKYQV